MKKITPRIFVLAAIVGIFSMSAFAQAVFTTDIWGQPVNQNFFNTQDDVYLNGGPNNGNAAGLEPNTAYYFQVTDPSGKTLLSNDYAECRMAVTDSNGRLASPFTPLSPLFSGCLSNNGQNQHNAGEASEFPGVFGVQLAPFDETPNNGGVYKVWLISVDDAEIGPDGKSLSFKNSSAKTDTFKVLNYNHGD